MDADDVCLPNRFSYQLKAFSDVSVALVGSWATKINEAGEEIGAMSYPPTEYQQIKSFFIKHNPFIHSSIMIKKEVFDTVGVYNSKYKHAEDYELWSRVLKKFKAVNIPEPLIKYRINNSGVTKQYNLFMRYQGLKIRALGFIRLYL